MADSHAAALVRRNVPWLLAICLVWASVGTATPLAMCQQPGKSTLGETSRAPKRASAATEKSDASNNSAGRSNGSNPLSQFAPGAARTSFYGIDGEGFKFVYVFDRSASMGEGSGSPLEAAKRELWKSLATLGPTHQFQIIFYNERPRIFSPTGVANRLVFATDANKKQAKNFIEGISADGGTEHEDALDMALRLHPDVVFFLTDADEPAMSDEQLRRINRKNQSAAAVHCIEFGERDAAGENFLARLAHQNGGQYVYKNITQPAALDAK